LTISAVGGLAQNHGTGITTVAVGSPVVGHTLVLVVRVSSTTINAVSVTGGLVSSWATVTGFTDTLTGAHVDVFYGTVTGTGSSTATITFSSSNAGISTEVVSQEFASSIPGASWVVAAPAADIDGTGTALTFPSITAAAGGQLYFGYAFVAGTAAAGSTSGYTYAVTTAGNLVTFNPLASGVNAPTATQSPSGNWSAVGFVLNDDAPTAPPTLNQNFPQMEYGWGALWNCNAGDSPLDRYVDVTPRTQGTIGTQRGRQYELDLVQSGTLRASLTSSDGALDPNNAGGPWGGHIWPYQPFRVRAQWPPTVNILAPVIANGGDGQPTGALNAGNNGQDVLTNTDPATGSIVASASAYSGSNVFQFSVPASTAVGKRICFTPQPAVLPNTSYTMTMRVRNITDSTSLDVQPFIGWYGPPPAAPPTAYVSGPVATLTGSSVATGWTTITVTATAPANPYGMAVGVSVATSNSATCSVQVDGWQLEKGTTASAFVSPGTWYPMYAGFIERWPQSWALNNTLGMVEPTGVDAFALLSQRILRAPFTEEIYRRNPSFLFTLGDPSGVQSFADSTGNFPAPQINSGKFGPGSLTSGNSITSSSSTGAYTGSSGSVVTISNSNPGSPTPGPASFISLSGAGIRGPVTPTTWTRMVAFRYTGPTPTDRAVIWSTMDRQRSGGLPSGSQFWLTIDSSGKFYAALGGPTGNNVTGYYPQVGGSTVSVNDGNWHLVGVSMNATTGDLWVSIDGNSSYWANAGAHNPTKCLSDALGNWIDDTTGNGSVWNFKGDISYAMEFPTALSGSDFTTIYSAWKNSFSGDSTDQRYARILTYAGYNGPSTIQTGLTTSMGPMNTDGQDALSALGDVVITENGEHYVDRVGSIIFRSRSARYNSTTPAYVFGENVSAGEYPYEEVELDFDPTHLANLVQVTQSSTNQVFTAADATSQTNYFPRTMQRDVNSSSALECQDAAGYLMSRYRNPLPRVSTLKLHPAANPSLWPVCLGLELGARVRIMRRPLGAPAIQIDAFVENIAWNLDDKGEAFLTLQCSPVDATPYASFAAWHTTLNGALSSGATTITVNASSDTVNPLAAQVGYGQQLVLGLGTANAETVTVLSVGATSPGWTTGTITLQAATTKAHSANDVVSEPLPAGVTSTSTYDTLAKLDSVAFAY
jgi:hypothetical protein